MSTAALTICVFALALSVVGFVAVVWITSTLGTRMKRLESSQSHANKHLADLDSKVDRTSNAKLAADVVDLRAALDTLASSNRREFGRLHARARKEAPQVIDGEIEDSELHDLLAFQNAPPVRPT